MIANTTLKKFRIVAHFVVYNSVLRYDTPDCEVTYEREVKEDYYTIARPDKGWHEVRVSKIEDDQVTICDAIELTYSGWTYEIGCKREYTLKIGGTIKIEDSRISPRDSSKTDWFVVEISLLKATPEEIYALQDEELRNLSGMQRDSMANRLASDPDDPQARRFKEANNL